MESTHQSQHVMADWFTSLRERSEFIVFKPYLDDQRWGEISSEAFKDDLASSASYYRQTLLSKIDVDTSLSTTIVGVWLTGRKYNDTLTILGLMIAGFVPQLFSSVFPNSEVLWDLMEGSGARALVYDEVFTDQLFSCRVPALCATTIFLPPQDSTPLPIAKHTDIALIVHSSGTTSGMPKIIPVTHGWLESFIKVKYSATLKQGNYDDCNVTNTLGNLAHVGSIAAFMAAVYQGFCTVQSSSMSAPTAELAAMITTCGVNRLVLYASFLSTHIKEARKNPAIASVFASCRQILHTGVSLPREDEEWAVNNGFPITTMYGCTETAPLMTSVLGSDKSTTLLRMIPGIESAALIPYTMPVSASDEVKCFEVVCYQGKRDSPHSSLFKTEDDLFHTDDIFEEVLPGLYKFRGRKGDWIKTLNGFCDARSIEENVRQTCGDLIHDVAVVGDDRPLPCLFVEVPEETDTLGKDTSSLVSEIIERTKSFNARLFTYERIEDPRRIVILSHGGLPRTKEKGNVRRNAIANLFEAQLDQIFLQA